jgi:hypothetical protein
LKPMRIEITLVLFQCFDDMKKIGAFVIYLYQTT